MRIPGTDRRLRQESNRLAREEEARRLNESEATQVVAATERERAAKEKRGREEKEFLEREESDRRRAEVDVALISGKGPDLIPYSVRGVTAAQVRARQLELARLKENRGNPWTELALDREIARLLSLGTKRDAIRDQLHPA